MLRERQRPSEISQMSNLRILKFLLVLSYLNRLYFISVRQTRLHPCQNFIFLKFDYTFSLFTERSSLSTKGDFMKIKKEYFTRFPNKYIQGDIKKNFGISRKFYITYILIDKYRSYEDFSWITIRKILNFYGYKTTKNKPKAVYEILDVLEYMINNKMIEVQQDLDSVSYDTGIEIKIIKENFDCPNHFSRLTASQYDTVMMADSSLNKENLLMAFLYINSYIGCRQRKDDGSEYSDAYKTPEAFFKSIDNMSKDLAMSKDTINQCIKYLTTSSNKHKALLVKKEVGSVQPNKNKPPKNVPNIYVLNNDRCHQEIEWALNKMLEIYDVKEFLPPICKVDK